MKKSDIENHILEVLAETTLRDPGAISHSMHLEADLGLDSISMSSLIAKFETLITDSSQMATCVQSLLAAETVGELIEIIYNNSHAGSKS